MRAFIVILFFEWLLAGAGPSAGGRCAVRAGEDTVAGERLDTAFVRRVREAEVDTATAVALYYTEGVKRAIIDGPAAALPYFEAALEMEPRHAPSHFEKGNALVVLQCMPQAMKSMERAVELDSLNKWYLDRYARLLVMNREYERAMPVYRRLLRAESRSPEVYRILAALYEQKQMPVSAVSVLDSAEIKLGRISELSDYKRHLLMSIRQYDRALKETEAMIEENPYNEENYRVMADIYAQSGRDSLAVVYYEKALEVNPGSVMALAALNKFYEERNDDRNFMRTAEKLFLSEDIELKTKIDFFGDITRDIDFYRNNYFTINSIASTLAARYPGSYEAMELYAGHLIKSGELEKALELYKSHTEDSLRRVELFSAIMEIEAYLQRPDSLYKYADMAIRAYPERVENYMQKGGALQYMERYGEALKAYKAGLRYAENDSVRSVIVGTIGDLYHTMDNYKKSFQYYDKALGYDPDNTTVLNNYAYYMSLRDLELERGLEMIEKVIAIEGNNPTYLDTKGYILYKLGRYDEAKRVQLLAISLDSRQSGELFFHYGDILYALGDKFMAKVYWKRALEKGHDAEEIRSRLEMAEEPEQ